LHRTVADVGGAVHLARQPQELPSAQVSNFQIGTVAFTSSMQSERR